jgi:hypothetical protein
MYFLSTEVRWFFQGRLAKRDVLIDWFTKPIGGYGSNPEELLTFEGEDPKSPRIDSYLILGGASTVGTKLRGGDKGTSLEVKAQASAPATFQFQEGISGRVDSWVKWSFKDDSLTKALAPMQQTGQWIRIAKDRWLRKISADGREPQFVVADAKAYKKNPALGKLPDYGCNFELTQLYVDNDRENSRKAWYTICLEAFGPDISRTPAVLSSCARLCFRELGFPSSIKFHESNSFSYPAWFVKLEGF